MKTKNVTPTKSRATYHKTKRVTRPAAAENVRLKATTSAQMDHKPQIRCQRQQEIAQQFLAPAPNWLHGFFHSVPPCAAEPPASSNR